MGVRPSQGYSDVHATSAPGETPARSMVPVVHNKVYEPMVNAAATYPIFLRAWKKGYEQYFMPPDIMFIDTQDPVAAYTKIPMYRMFNVPTLMWYLNSIDAGQARTQEDRFGRAATRMTSDEVLGSLKMFGVMWNDQQLTGGAPQRLFQASYQRLINCAVRGATRIKNYWPGVSIGDHVFLAVVENFEVTNPWPHGVDPERKFTLDNTIREQERGIMILQQQIRALRQHPAGAPAAHGIAELEAAVHARQLEVRECQSAKHKNRYTIVPFTSRTLREADMQKQLRNQRRIFYLGFVYELVGSGDEVTERQVSQAMCSFDANINLPAIRVFMRC
jgi:hypothetical protein